MKGKAIITQIAEKVNNYMKFENLFNVMRCDFFEIQKAGEEIQHIEYELSGKMLKACKPYFDDTVIDFYIIRSKTSNDLGLLIRLA